MADRMKGTSLAKGPSGVIGAILLAYGVTGLAFGGQDFGSDPLDGTVSGETWLGIEGNGWTNLLFIAAGGLLLFGAPLHWGAKGMALVVGLALGAASVIALADGEDVFGIFAANGPTTLAWGVAAAVLLLVALLPRVGARRRREARAGDGAAAPGRRFGRRRGEAASGREPAGREPAGTAPPRERT